MLPGFLLILGGGLIALGSQQDWLTAHLAGNQSAGLNAAGSRFAGNQSATLNSAGSRFGIAMLVFAALILVLGFVRISRGYAKDASLHQIASWASFAAIAMALARTGLFMSDHSLAITSTSSYGHLSLELGVYLLIAGFISTLVSRLA